MWFSASIIWIPNTSPWIPFSSPLYPTPFINDKTTNLLWIIDSITGISKVATPCTSHLSLIYPTLFSWGWHINFILIFNFHHSYVNNRYPFHLLCLTSIPCLFYGGWDTHNFTIIIIKHHCNINNNFPLHFFCLITLTWPLIFLMKF